MSIALAAIVIIAPTQCVPFYTSGDTVTQDCSNYWMDQAAIFEWIEARSERLNDDVVMGVLDREENRLYHDAHSEYVNCLDREGTQLSRSSPVTAATVKLTFERCEHAREALTDAISKDPKLKARSEGSMPIEARLWAPLYRVMAAKRRSPPAE